MDATVCSRARALLMCVVVLLSSVALTLFEHVTPATAATISGGWTAPLEDMSGDLSNYLAHKCEVPGGGIYSQTDRYHIGDDVMASAGITVHAIAAGVVKYSGSFGPGFGNVVFVLHTAQDGTQFLAEYGHIDIAGGLAASVEIAAGQDIGTVYNMTASHLHFGIRPGTTYPTTNWGMMPCTADGSRPTNGFVDPFPYLAAHPLGGSAATGSSTPSILALKRTTDPGGTRQVYAATNAAVTEAYWVPGSNDGVHTHEVISIAQGDIVGFDKVNLPDGKQALYTAVTDGIWETYWGGGVNPSSAKIVSGLSGVRQVVADNRWENGQFVHHLYVLAGNGPYEVWWRDGGDGVHVSLLNSIAGAVTMTKSSVDGVEQLYVATPTWVYELWWIPGSGTVHAGTILNVSQGDIRSLAKDRFGPSGQLLYTGTSTSAWQSYWAPGVGIETHAVVTNQTNAIQIQKTNFGDSHQLYLATGDHVQEYWWKDDGSTGGGELIRISQGNIRAFEKYNDGAAQQLYTAAGNWVYETWWGDGHSPSTSGLFSVTR